MKGPRLQGRTRVQERASRAWCLRWGELVSAWGSAESWGKGWPLEFEGVGNLGQDWSQDSPGQASHAPSYPRGHRRRCA